MDARKSFGSDNHSGAHPDIIKAIAEANSGHAEAYGHDKLTRAAGDIFKREFGEDTETLLALTGTGANVIALASAARPHNSVVCTNVSHIYVHECNAVERFAACRLEPIPAPDGKLTVAGVEPLLVNAGDEHCAQPGVISITQATERGTLYTPEEISALAEFAHRNGMYAHLDGARIANAAAALGMSFRALTRDLGVDILSFGGTKNGLMFAEAVVWLNPALAKDAVFIRKQAGQLASKMRFVAAQFIAYLSDGLWRRNAEHSNRMAALLAGRLAEVESARITQKVEANMVFAVLPRRSIDALSGEFGFGVVDPAMGEIRLVASFDTTESDVDNFIRALKNAM